MIKPQRLRTWLGADMIVRAVYLSLSLICTALTAGCMASAPPPQVQSQAPQPPVSVGFDRRITLAVDETGLGFNPHLLAFQSVATTAISAMTLPSAFRTIQTPVGSKYLLDDALLLSAEVLKKAGPFTVRYIVNPAAQWSDGLPIGAEDFNYLWQQMRRQPGVVAPAGYRLISKMESRAGGKEISVIFTRPYAGWRELFNNLLPSHALKGAPGGFQSAMTAGRYASGGPYEVSSVDLTRGEVRLIRNDRYWKAAAINQWVLVRRAGSNAQLVNSIRYSDTHLAAVGVSQSVLAQVRAMQSVEVHTRPTSRLMALSVNTRTELMSDRLLRRVLLRSLDRGTLTLAGVGDKRTLLADDGIYAPSDFGYAERQPLKIPSGKISIDDVTKFLIGKGYTPVLVNDKQGTKKKLEKFVKNGKDLVIRIGIVAGDEQSNSVAANALDQLKQSGIGVTIVPVNAADLYGKELTNNTVDLVLGWHAVGPSPATTALSRFDCANLSSGNPSVVDPDFYTSNVSGYCKPELNSLLLQAISAPNPQLLLAQAANLVDEAAVYLPLYQDLSLSLVGPGVTGVTETGGVSELIFGNSGAWKRID